MSEKLCGFRFSPTVQEVLHTIEICGANIPLDNVNWTDEAKLRSISNKTSTRTLPFLTIKEGTISEVKAINQYIAEKYKPEVLGKSLFEKAQIQQWVEFADEFQRCGEEIYYPIFGWREYNRERAENAEKRVLEFFKALDQQVKGKKFVMGDHQTLADTALFRALKPFMQLVYPEGKRKNVFRNVDDWFRRVYNTPEADAVYGQFHLCKAPLKAPAPAEKKEAKKEGGKKDAGKKEEKKPKEEKADDAEEEAPKKKKDPMDSLPPTNFILEDFKRRFINNKDKKAALEDFFKTYDPAGYTIYWLQYQNLPTEGKDYVRTKNSLSYFIQRSDIVRKYTFGTIGIYGVEGDYKVRGVWMFRGKGIPQILTDNNEVFEYYDKRELNINDSKDKELLSEYWSKFNEDDKVEDRLVAHAEYFN